MKDAVHFTIDLKDAKMMKDKSHLTVHGYLDSKLATGNITNMWNVGEVSPKKGTDGSLGKVERDGYFDKKKAGGSTIGV